MYRAWIVLYILLPLLLILGFTGIFGKESKRAAFTAAKKGSLFLIFLLILSAVGYFFYLIFEWIK